MSPGKLLFCTFDGKIVMQNFKTQPCYGEPKIIAAQFLRNTWKTFFVVRVYQWCIFQMSSTSYKIV